MNLGIYKMGLNKINIEIHVEKQTKLYAQFSNFKKVNYFQCCSIIIIIIYTQKIKNIFYQMSIIYWLFTYLIELYIIIH